MQLLFRAADYRLIALKMSRYQITHGLQFAKVFFAKLPAVLILQSFLLPMFFIVQCLMFKDVCVLY